MQNFDIKGLSVALFAFVIFGVFWRLTGRKLATDGGWRQLAERFPARGVPTGRKCRMSLGMVGRGMYQGTLRIHSSPEGIHLRVAWLFGAGHAPLFIPWSEIHEARAEEFFGIEGVAFEVGSPCVGEMLLPREVFAEHSGVKIAEDTLEPESEA